MVTNYDGRDCQIFLSHSGQQKHIVEDLFIQLRRILRDRPPSTIFFDRSVNSIPLGNNIFNNIENAIYACVVGVLVISPDFLESEWPMRELIWLMERHQNGNSISLCPIFYNTRDINETLKSETAILKKWRKKWSTFGTGVDVQKWAGYVVKLKNIRGKLLTPNETVALEIYNIAIEITNQLPSSLGAPHPPPSPPSQANYNGRLDLRIKKQPAQCLYTTSGSLKSAKKNVSFYLRSMEHDAPQDDHCPKPCFLGQQPEPGTPNQSMVETLLFAHSEQARANSSPIGGGKEWWECIWTDHGQVIYRDDHSCWRVKADKIPQGYVCLSPSFFKIDTLENRMKKSSSLKDLLVLKEDYMPPSSEDVQGMVAINEKFVTYVSGEKLIKVWKDRGSGATKPLAIYTGPDFCGCFAFTTYDQPKGGSYPILDRSKFH